LGGPVNVKPTKIGIVSRDRRRLEFDREAPSD